MFAEFLPTATRAIMVCRIMFSCPPKTVDTLRPLEAAFAIASCWRARAVKDDLSMSAFLRDGGWPDVAALDGGVLFGSWPPQVGA